MAHLYISSRGKPWRRHSYSAGQTFDKCAYFYYLQKVLGWKQKDNKASFLFGKAVEDAIQHHHEHDGVGALDKFVHLWTMHKETPNISYTDVESDWATCLKMGSDMIRLYVVRQPELPIPMGGRSVFQREYVKEVFPGDPNYGEIEHLGKLDIVCYVDPNHDKLPKVDWKPEYGAFRPVIVDIKTSAVDFAEQPGMASLDLQLRCYSWLSGIRDAGLLWFVKKGLGFKKGYSVTLLDDVGIFKAGSEAVVAKMGDNDTVWILSNDFMIDEMERAQGKKEDGKTDQTNVAKERALNFLQQHGGLVSTNNLTKQRLQFNVGFISEKSANEAGMISARQIQQIVNASKNNEWPNTAGIRYPTDSRNDPYFRAFLLKDENYKQQNFTKSDEEMFDTLFEDDDNG